MSPILVDVLCYLLPGGTGFNQGNTKLLVSGNIFPCRSCSSRRRIVGLCPDLSDPTPAFGNPGASKLNIVNCVLCLTGFRSAWPARMPLVTLPVLSLSGYEVHRGGRSSARAVPCGSGDLLSLSPSSRSRTDSVSSSLRILGTRLLSAAVLFAHTSERLEKHYLQSYYWKALWNGQQRAEPLYTRRNDEEIRQFRAENCNSVVTDLSNRAGPRADELSSN